MKDYCAEFKNYLIKVKKVSNNTLDSYLRDLQNYLEFLKKIGRASCRERV